MRKLLLIVVCCTATLLAGYAGYRSYKVWRQEHFMRLARESLAKSDVRNGTLFLNKVLQSNPQHLGATRIMAQLADAAHSPAALSWRSRVVDLNPHSLNDRLALAQTALTLHEYAFATNALEGVDATARGTAAYQNLAGEADAAANHFASAELHFIEAARLDPQNPAPQLSLALVRLRGTNVAAQAEARSVLGRLTSNPTNSALRCEALRSLAMDAMGHKQQDAALTLTKRLTQETNSTFTDRLLRLEVLLENGNADFKPALAACQRDASVNPGAIYELAMWEMAKI
jgi:hypothetical protein